MTSVLVETIDGSGVLNFESASFSSFRDSPKSHFVTAEEAAAADIDDSIKRKRIGVSLKNLANEKELRYRHMLCLYITYDLGVNKIS